MPQGFPPGCCSCGLAGIDGRRGRGSLGSNTRGQGRCTRAQGQNMRAPGLNMREQGRGHYRREPGENTRAEVQGLGQCMRRKRNHQKVLLQQRRMRGTLSCHQMGSFLPGSSKSLEGCKISFKLKFQMHSQVCHSDISLEGHLCSGG